MRKSAAHTHVTDGTPFESVLNNQGSYVILRRSAKENQTYRVLPSFGAHGERERETTKICFIPILR